MSLENDFLVFAGASGANVLTQAAYASSTTLAGGYITGTASSAAVNKTLRQTSIISAMIAQFICDNAAQPAIDNGTIATLETNFEAAILAIADTVNIPISQVEGLAAELAGFLPLTGNAVSASKLATARNIALTGAVTGAVNFDGSSNVSITTAFGSMAASSLLGNPTSSAATPSAITLANGLIFSGTTLGLGAITPSTVSASGSIVGSSTTTLILDTASGGEIYLRPNGSGSATGQVTIDSSGDIAASGAISGTSITASGTNVTSGLYFISSTSNVVLAPTGAGSVIFRPNGTASTTGQATLNSAGLLTLASDCTVNQNFIGAGSNVVLATTGAGTCYFRPNGTSSTAGQMFVNSSGNLVASGTIQPGSDIRIKDNVTRIDGQYALHAIRHHLVGVEYDRNDQGGKHEAGFIANRVIDGMPFMGDTHEEMNGLKDFKTLNYNGVEAYHSNAITELHDIVIRQDARIAKLEGRHQ